MKRFTIRRVVCAFVLPIFFLSCVLSQKQREGYKIDFTVEGLQDVTVQLGFYYQGNTYVKDSVVVSPSGLFSFAGEKSLEPGFYFLLLDKALLFEFIVGGDQHFSVSTSKDDYMGNLAFAGSEENDLFAESLKKNAAMHRAMQPYLEVVKDTTSDKKQREEAAEHARKIQEELVAYRAEMVAADEDRLLAKMIKANMEATVPKEVSSEGAERHYVYLKEHYFDNFPLSDEQLLRLPKDYFKEKVTYYLDSLTPPEGDEVIAAIEHLATLTDGNEKTYQYLIWLCTRKYQKPAIMGLDKVLVHLYDAHYAAGKMDGWANEKLKKNLKEYVDKLRLSLIGNTAPEIILKDINEQAVSLYALREKYRVIYFFDPDCGACKVETPKLMELMKNTQHDMSLYAVALDKDLEKIRTYVEQMQLNSPRTHVVTAYESYKGNVYELYDAFSTPTTYIIDRDNTIIAKKIPADQVEKFLTGYEEVLRESGQSGEE